MTSAARKMYQEMSELIRQGQAETAATRLNAWLSAHPDDAIGLSLLGSAQLQGGQAKAALETLRRAVAAHADSYAAHGDLAFALMRAGDTSAAIESFAQAVTLKPNFYQGHCYLSKLRFENGLLREACDTLARAEACDPFALEFPKIQAAMSAKRFADAEKIARALLDRQPGYPKAAYTLAHLATSVGAHEEAAAILTKSIESYPCDVKLRAALVNSCEETGDYLRALDEARAIAVLDADSSTPWLIIGRIHGHCGHYEDSLAAYDKALALADGKPQDAGNIQLLRGHLLKILGRYEDGIEAYRSSIATVENNGAGWWGLADMKTHRFTEADKKAMRALVENTAIRPEQRTQAAFALAKAQEDSGEFAAAFDAYRTANDLRTGISFDPPANSAGIGTLIETFSRELLDRTGAGRIDGPTPIFVVGLPRSGSTLVEQILASHSQIEGTMELVNLPNVVRLMTIAGGKHQLPYPASVAKFSREELQSFGQAYLDATAIYRQGKPFFIDKLPTNFDKIGLIHLILPHAIVIDARRHPLDCGLSCYKQHFAGGHHFSYRLEHIGRYYNDYLRLMDHWDEALPGKVLCVQYETMVADTEASIRTLLQHCGVAFEPGCLKFYDNKRAVRTASSEQVRQPIYARSVGHWKNFARELEPLIDALGAATLARFEHF